MERFMELYEAVYKDLYKTAYYLMGNPADAEDAVSEAVMRAYANFSGLRREEAFRGWIFQILINECKTQLRKRTKKGYSELKEEPSYHPELGDQTYALELLESLSEEEQQIILLTVFGGYKGEEIARILNRRHSTIRSKYRRALKKLEQRIQAEEVQYDR